MALRDALRHWPVLRFLTAASVVFVAVALVGCVGSGRRAHQTHGHGHGHVHAKQGPPPHAPAHGYRHKHHHHGVDLVFDSGLGVYVVAGHAELYFWNDRYYRWRDGAWQVSVRLDRGFVVVGSGDLPRRLAHKHARHPGRGHGPAKRKKW